MVSKPRLHHVPSFVHLLNRGVEKRTIFIDHNDYHRFLISIPYYALGFTDLSTYLKNLKQRLKLPTFNATFQVGLKELEKKKRLEEARPLVDILAFALMPNHFHLLLRQIIEGGIALFTQRLSNSYAKYFNTKHERIGPLFQGVYKSILIETDEQLLHVSRYIHLNPTELVSTKRKAIISFLRHYSWSSYPAYLGLQNNGLEKLINKEPILGYFNKSIWVKGQKVSRNKEVSYQKFVESYLENPAIGIENLALE